MTFLLNVFASAGSCLFLVPVPNVSDVFFDCTTSLQRYFYVPLSSRGGAAQIYSERETCERWKDVWKVVFFQPFSPAQKKCIFLKGMKILDFSFLSFVLTNKNLCLKRCVVFCVSSNSTTSQASESPTAAGLPSQPPFHSLLPCNNILK